MGGGLKHLIIINGFIIMPEPHNMQIPGNLALEKNPLLTGARVSKWNNDKRKRNSCRLKMFQERGLQI